MKSIVWKQKQSCYKNIESLVQIKHLAFHWTSFVKAVLKQHIIDNLDWIFVSDASQKTFINYWYQ
jgi:hypothetical protein